MPDKVAPKAHRNMKKGYGLWKESYVNSYIMFKSRQTCNENSTTSGESSS
ncbi:Hypothetical predicted protein [Paramuricea clavata]|uniref:Uncharacterized protein n=1 Tax=Paramuricea clavata TaxID=317549 RepID=A0A6S7LQ62_PARCT|nr:Hypothetical predicted protein [Paramuricea clavata]